MDKELTGNELPSESLNALADELSSSVKETIINNRGDEINSDMVNDAAKLNVQNTIQRILQSPIIKKAHEEKEVGITGAFCSLDTGKAEFIDI